jgi:GNAT superfamily N-acetyltransferase
MSRVQIRSAQATDGAAIDAAGYAAALHHHLADPELLPQPDQHSTEWSAGALSGAPEAACLVAEIDEQVIGYVYATVVSESRPMFVPHRYGRIEAVAVRPEFRSRGIGTSLLRAAEQWLSEQGCEIVRLNVFTSNTAACALHTRRGYTPVVTLLERSTEGEQKRSTTTIASTQVRETSAADVGAISRLVHASFNEHIAPGWEARARAEFLTETEPEPLAERIAAAALCLVHEGNAGINGVILLPRPTLVQLFFVAPTELRQGIGRKLWETTRSHVEEPS